MTMNTEQVKNTVSQIVTGIAMFFAGRGWISNELVVPIVSAVVALLSLAFMIWDNTKIAMISKVADLPEVDGVKVNDPAVASATPPNVTLNITPRV